MITLVPSASVSSSSASKISDLGSAPGIMRVGDSNSDVKKLQQIILANGGNLYDFTELTTRKNESVKNRNGDEAKFFEKLKEKNGK